MVVPSIVVEASKTYWPEVRDRVNSAEPEAPV